MTTQLITYQRGHKSEQLCPYCNKELIYAVTPQGAETEVCYDPACEEKVYIEFMKKSPEKVLYRQGVFGDYLGCTLNNFKTKDDLMIAKCREFVADPKYGLVLIGNTGTGKTHLAAAVTRGIAQTGIRTLYFRSTLDIIREIKDSYNEDSRFTELELTKKYSNADFLVIDDLGSEKHTEWSAQTLYSVIEDRIKEARPTVITTNLSLGEIASQISKRIASRLAMYTVIKITMPDYRMRRV